MRVMVATVRQKWIRIRSSSMATEWATSRGLPDLHLELDRPGGRRTAIEEALRRAIRDGRLAPGARLPSTRVLAADLGVARGTVTEAYDQLVAEGWLAARQGSGTVVAWAGGSDGPAAAPRGADRRRCQARRTTSARAARTCRRSPARVGGGGARALRTAPDADLRYGDPRGPASVPRGARRLPRPGAWRAGRPRPARDLQRLRAGAGAPDLDPSPPGAAAWRWRTRACARYRTVTARAELAIHLLDVDEDGADPSTSSAPARRTARAG